MQNIEILIANDKLSFEEIYEHLNPGHSHDEFVKQHIVSELMIKHPNHRFDLTKWTVTTPLPEVSWKNIYDAHDSVTGKKYRDLESEVRKVVRSKIANEEEMKRKESNRLHRLKLKESKPERDAKRAENKEKARIKGIKREAKKVKI